MKINLNAVSEVETLSPSVASAIKSVTFKHSQREIEGFVNTVSTKLHDHHQFKAVRDRLKLLEKCDVSVATLCQAESLALHAQEMGCWDVRNKAQHLRNMLKKSLKEVV
jgi:hypothetical protein